MGISDWARIFCCVFYFLLACWRYCVEESLTTGSRFLQWNFFSERASFNHTGIPTQESIHTAKLIIFVFPCLTRAIIFWSSFSSDDRSRIFTRGAKNNKDMAKSGRRLERNRFGRTFGRTLRPVRGQHLRSRSGGERNESFKRNRIVAKLSKRIYVA